MSNMSYCRFENTYKDLLDCEEYWDDVDEDNEREVKYRELMIKLCNRIAGNYGEDD